MSDEIQKEVLNRLENLDSNLKLYLNLFKLINADKIEEMKQKMIKSDARKVVYELCENPKSAKEIAKILGKTPQNIHYHLNALTLVGLLSHRVKGGERYYFKTLE